MLELLLTVRQWLALIPTLKGLGFSARIHNLKNDVVVGEKIKYEKIPRYYKKRHDIGNAFHVYLPKGMRLIYSITNYQGKKTAFLMELADHKKYEQRFKY